MTQTIGTIMLFFSIFMLGGVCFVKIDQLYKLGLIREVTVFIGLGALIGLFLMTGGI